VDHVRRAAAADKRAAPVPGRRRGAPASGTGAAVSVEIADRQIIGQARTQLADLVAYIETL
jgi:hypothetical protein